MRGPFALLFAAWVGLAPDAWAGTPSSRLVYARGPGAEQCPDEDVFRKEVASRLGYDPFFPWASRTVSVELDVADGRGHARVVIIDDKGLERGSQTIDGGRGPSCEPLVRSAALAVSVTLEAMVPDPAPPPPETETATEVAPVVPPPPPVEIAPPPPVARHEAPRVRNTPTRHPRMSLAPQIWAGYGQWPVVMAGVGAAVELRQSWWSFALEGRWDIPATLDLQESESAQVQRATGAFVPCGHLGMLALCGMASLGATWATGVDVSSPQTASAFYAGFGVRVGLEVLLGRRLRWAILAQALGIATPMHLIVLGSNQFDSGPVEASVGTSLSVSIF